jgi:hypothetical protein
MGSSLSFISALTSPDRSSGVKLSAKGGRPAQSDHRQRGGPTKVTCGGHVCLIKRANFRSCTGQIKTRS